MHWVWSKSSFWKCRKGWKTSTSRLVYPQFYNTVHWKIKDFLDSFSASRHLLFTLTNHIKILYMFHGSLNWPLGWFKVFGDFFGLNLNFQPSENINFHYNVCQLVWVVMAKENMRKCFESLGFLIHPNLVQFTFCNVCLCVCPSIPSLFLRKKTSKCQHLTVRYYNKWGGLGIQPQSTLSCWKNLPPWIKAAFIILTYWEI